VSDSSDWGEFPNTILIFDVDDTSSEIDLRRPIESAQLEILARAGLQRQFGILTAQDPRGKTQPKSVNLELERGLRAELEAGSIPYVKVQACSPDHSHSEQSVAVVRPRDELVMLARKYEQLAIFWFGGGRFWILPAMSDNPPMALPPATNT
jgi:hypothetical protein